MCPKYDTYLIFVCIQMQNSVPIGGLNSIGGANSRLNEGGGGGSGAADISHLSSQAYGKRNFQPDILESNGKCTIVMNYHEGDVSYSYKLTFIILIIIKALQR